MTDDLLADLERKGVKIPKGLILCIREGSINDADFYIPDLRVALYKPRKYLWGKRMTSWFLVTHATLTYIVQAVDSACREYVQESATEKTKSKYVGVYSHD